MSMSASGTKRTATRTLSNVCFSGVKRTPFRAAQYVR
jgi:hypothetical protein